MEIKALCSALIDLIFPPRCIFCDTVIPSGDRSCGHCEENIRRSGSVKYMNVPETGKTIRCTVPYFYSGAVRDAIIRFKFQNQKHIALFFAVEMLAGIKKNYCLAEFDLITSVPVSAERYQTRGYNQSELLSREIAAKSGLPYYELLEKITDNREQHKLSEKERKKNVLGVYRPLHAEMLAGKKILLVDDIVTTGATLCECAKTLLRNGAEDVSCAAIAEVPIE